MPGRLSFICPLFDPSPEPSGMNHHSGELTGPRPFMANRKGPAGGGVSFSTCDLLQWPFLQKVASTKMPPGTFWVRTQIVIIAQQRVIDAMGTLCCLWGSKRHSLCYIETVSSLGGSVEQESLSFLCVHLKTSLYSSPCPVSGAGDTTVSLSPWGLDCSTGVVRKQLDTQMDECFKGNKHGDKIAIGDCVL